MEVLAEVHESKEYVPEAEQADLLGINARSLKEMRIMQGKAIEIYRELKSHKPVIAESGIKSAEDAFQLYKEGFDGFLIGTHFMAEPNPGFACKKFIHQLKELKEQ
jgi:indole-3-glycerol phosphate synthase